MEREISERRRKGVEREREDSAPKYIFFVSFFLVVCASRMKVIIHR